jgi:hypothetical protein
MIVDLLTNGLLPPSVFREHLANMGLRRAYDLGYRGAYTKVFFETEKCIVVIVSGGM